MPLSSRMQVYIDQQVDDVYLRLTRWPELCAAVHTAHSALKISNAENTALHAEIDRDMRADHGYVLKCVNIMCGASLTGTDITRSEIIARWKDWAAALVLRVQQELEQAKETT